MRGHINHFFFQFAHIDPFFSTRSHPIGPSFYNQFSTISPNDPLFDSLTTCRQNFIFNEIFVRNVSKFVFCHDNLPKFVWFSPFWGFSHYSNGLSFCKKKFAERPLGHTFSSSSTLSLPSWVPPPVKCVLPPDNYNIIIVSESVCSLDINI